MLINMKSLVQEEYNNMLIPVIRSIVPPNETLFIKEMTKVFSTPLKHIDPATIEHELYASMTESTADLNMKYYEVVKKYPKFRNQKYTDYVMSIMMGMLVYNFENEKGDSVEIIKGATFLKNNFELKALIHNDHQAFKPMIEYIDGQISKHNKQIDTDYLFPKQLIEKIDLELRGEWMDPQSPSLLSQMDRNNWHKNKPCINWENFDSAILYLFYLINENSRDIPGGKITELLAKTIIFKGKISSSKNLLKLLSKILKKVKITSKSLPDYFLEMKHIYNKCKLG